VEIVTIPTRDEAGNEKYILYRPMKGIAFVGNRAMVNLVSALNQGIAPDQPEAIRFLYEISFLEPDPPVPTVTGEPFQPTMAVLLMTNQCQLRCIYCYAEAGARSKEELPLELGKSAIDYVVRNALDLDKKQFSVSFHGGGEPVKAWNKLKACVEYARSQPLQSDITLTSNGLWSASQTEWIVANLNGVSLSIDGGRETQNRQRPTLAGNGSSEMAMRSAAALDRHQFSYGIRMTATAPWKTLAEDVRFLCEETRCQTIQVEPAFNTERGGHDQPTEADGQAFMEAVLEAYDVAESYQRRFYYAAARIGSVTDAFCSSPYSALIVKPNGELVSCYEVTNNDHPLAKISTIGRIVDGEVTWDLAARKHLHTLMAERREGCRDCFCYWTCAGNCYTRTFEPGSQGHLQYGILCEIARKLVEAQLLRRIEKSGGVWNRQAEPTQPGNHPSDQVKIENGKPLESRKVD
jgi:uncharacterized protein